MRRLFLASAILAVLLLLVTAICYLWALSVHQKTPVVFRFSHARDLQQGSRVRVSGVEVGSVETVGLGQDGVTVTANLNRDACSHIPDDSIAYLVESYRRSDIEISLGKSTTSIDEGSVIQGYVDISEKRIRRLEKVITAIKNTADNTVLSSESREQRIAELRKIKKELLRVGRDSIKATRDKLPVLQRQIEDLIARWSGEDEPEKNSEE